MWLSSLFYTQQGWTQSTDHSFEWTKSYFYILGRRRDKALQKQSSYWKTFVLAMWCRLSTNLYHILLGGSCKGNTIYVLNLVHKENQEIHETKGFSDTNSGLSPCSWLAVSCIIFVTFLSYLAFTYERIFIKHKEPQ